MKDKTIVDAAFLRDPVFLPHGGVESTLNASRLPGIEMLWIKGEGIDYSFRGRSGFIPSSNIVGIHYSKK
jgi:hypothetical protein